MNRVLPWGEDTADGPPWRRWLETRPEVDTGMPWISTLLTAVLVMVGTHFAAADQPDRVSLDTLARVLLLAGPVLLLLRNRAPSVATLSTSAVVVVYLFLGYPFGPIYVTVVVSVFSAVNARRRWAAWWSLGMLWAAHVALGVWLYSSLPPSGDEGAGWGGALATTAWMAAIAAVSELVRVRREQWARDRRERAAAERRRADEERLRIARELHDVLAHSISVINVQAGVGLALLDNDPEQARVALTTVKSASKEALGEVRQVLDSLRAPGDAPRGPAPGLERLGELAEQAERAGLRVTTHTEGSPAPLPPGADLAAFRIVQEALTNVVRHSASRQARVELRYGHDELTIRIDDDGPANTAVAAEPGTSAQSGGGNGLVGMRERAAVYGGGVEAGPRPGGGFRVLAKLPLT